MRSNPSIGVIEKASQIEKESTFELNALEKGRHMGVIMIVAYATMFGNTVDNVAITKEEHGDGVLLILFIANIVRKIE